MRTRALLPALSFAAVAPASGQGIMGEMHRDVNEAQKKMVDLAKAIPESAYGWRPGTGVRTETIKFVGQDYTRQRAMVGTVTHLHEHLGQLIAYARSNNVVPPWSK